METPLTISSADVALTPATLSSSTSAAETVQSWAPSAVLTVASSARPAWSARAETVASSQPQL
eukprot:6515921-Heterocapsa_arctica.AAC.1